MIKAANNEDYELKIISDSNKKYRQFNVDGINTIGISSGEEFKISIRNKTARTIGVKISVDGTNILTGKEATLKSGVKDMYLIDPYDSCDYACWQEGESGGSKLVFTTAESSVSVHTHGNTKNVGIISVAVFYDQFENTFKKSQQYGSININDVHFNNKKFLRHSGIGSVGTDINDNWLGQHDVYTTCLPCSASTSTAGNLNVLNNTSTAEASKTSNYLNIDMERTTDNTITVNSAAVGAGNFVEQNVNFRPGLKSPKLDAILRIKYVFEDDLIKLINKQNTEIKKHAYGFNDYVEENNFADLSKVPKVSTNKKENIQFYKFE